MSKNTKVIWIAVVVLVVVGLVAWWSGSQNMQYGSTSGTSGGLAAGNSDQAINQNLASIDTQMSGLSSDSASIDQGLNDQPVQQAQL